MPHLRLVMTLDEPTARRWLTALEDLRAAMTRLERTAAKANLGAYTRRPAPTPRRFDELEAYARQHGIARRGQRTHAKGRHS